MAKKSWTTRMDDAVLELAGQIAERERRSITSLIEVLIIERGQQLGLQPMPEQPSVPRNTPS